MNKNEQFVITINRELGKRARRVPPMTVSQKGFYIVRQGGKTRKMLAK